MKRFAKTGPRGEPWRHYLCGCKMYLEKENMYLMFQIQKVFFNSDLVIVEPRLYSNNKLTAISIVCLNGILLNKLQTSKEIKNLLVALTSFIPLQNIN